MEFGLSEDQRMMQASLGKMLEKTCPLDHVRQIADASAALSLPVWREMSELGVAGILVPEQFGGMGQTLLDAALVAEGLGAHVAPAPFISTSVMAIIALSEAGSLRQKEAWLPQIAAGDLIVGVALSEAASGARENAGVKVSQGRLTGKALFVMDCVAADMFIAGDTNGGLHLVRGDAKGLTRIGLTSIDATRSLGELQFIDVEAEPLEAGDTLKTRQRMIDAGRVMLAADTLGAGTSMIAKAVAYASERKQFGRVIGSFQAVKHMCAEMASELEPCRSLVWYAAHSFDAMPDESRLMATHAKSLTSDVGRFVARTATEVHGGMGFTDLVGLHFWFKRIGVNRQLLGSPERVRLEAAQIQGWAA